MLGLAGKGKKNICTCPVFINMDGIHFSIFYKKGESYWERNQELLKMLNDFWGLIK